MLDLMDGDADHEDGGDDKPSLAAPENVTGSQVGYMRGGDRGREEAPEIALRTGALVLDEEIDRAIRERTFPVSAKDWKRLAWRPSKR
ncbi:hypothetical protein ACRBEV_32510 [Methylobacterium phyllosphaerae]